MIVPPPNLAPLQAWADDLDRRGVPAPRWVLCLLWLYVASAIGAIAFAAAVCLRLI